jgi:hypothetical protein
MRKDAAAAAPKRGGRKIRRETETEREAIAKEGTEQNEGTREREKKRLHTTSGQNIDRR